jgi:hypothetical protein
MKSGTGIKKSASRIAKHPVRIGWFGIREDFYLLSYPLEIARNLIKSSCGFRLGKWAEKER